MKFAKLQAAGNDFILVDARDKEQNWSTLARAMCHRQLGIGADGLVLVTESNTGDLKMRLFNPDGTEAEVSGNGLRCFAKYVIERKIAMGPSLSVETLAGIRTVHAFTSQGKVTRAKVDMGIPKFKPEEIPALITHPKRGGDKVDIMSMTTCTLNIDGKKLDLSLVSMGNPHAVSFLSHQVADFPLSRTGPKIENHPIFPERVNFEIARVIDRKNVEARVWERGVGETLSCGSGACAVAVAAIMRGYTDREVDIILPGGVLTVDWEMAGRVYLSGPVEEVFVGEWLK